MYHKRDILEVEMQYYDIAVLTRIPESATDIQAGATVYFGYKRFCSSHLVTKVNLND